MWRQIIEKLKEWWSKKVVGNKEIKDKLKISSAMSQDMETAIQLWKLMYVNKSPWLCDDDDKKVISLNLAAQIASEKSRTALVELKTSIYDKGTSAVTDTAFGANKAVTRASYLDSQYKFLLKKLRPKLEIGIALGGMIIKPYPVISKKTIRFDWCGADEFFPISFDQDERLIHAAFIERVIKDGVTYSRLEEHKLEKGIITVTNSAYKSTLAQTNNSDTLGILVPLSEVEEWASLTPQVHLTSQNNVEIDRLLVAYWKLPDANTIDTHSLLGVSGFARAARLIREADEQYSLLKWEFEGGALAIDIDRDALRTEINPITKESIEVLPALQQRLCRKVILSDGNGKDFYSVFSPAYRDASLLNGLNNILMRIEDAVALSRGTFSNPQADARTATELKILKQRSFSSNADIQNSLQDVLEDVVYIMDIYTSLNNFAPKGEYEMSFQWDDSIMVDVETELNQKLAMVSGGALYPEEVSAWYNGVSLEKRFADMKQYNKLKNKYAPAEDVIANEESDRGELEMLKALEKDNEV